MKVTLLLALSLLSSLAFAEPATTQPASLAGESHQVESATQHDLLRVRDADSADGTPIVLYPHQDWKCMTWKFEPAGTTDTDGVRLVNYFTHKTFSPDADRDGAPLSQHPAQNPPADLERWRFVPVGDLFRIENIATGKALTATEDGGVVIRSPDGSAAQQWKLLQKPAKFTG